MRHFRQALLSGTALMMLAGQAIAADTKPKPAAGATPSAPGPTATEIETLRWQIKVLEERLNKLQDNLAADVATVKKKTEEQGAVTYTNGRPGLKSADGQYTLGITARLHADGAAFFQDSNLPAAVPAANRDLGSGLTVRRGQFGATGKLGAEWDYTVNFEFGGAPTEGSGTSLHTAKLGYTGIANMRIEAGVLTPPLTLDDATSANDLPFMERASAGAALTSAYGGGDSRHALAITYAANGLFAAAAYTGAVSGTPRANDEGTQVVGRFAYRFLSGEGYNVQAGASGAVLTGVPGTSPTPVTLAGLTIQDRPENRVDGNRLVSTGPLSYSGGRAYALEFGANWLNFYLQAEYMGMRVNRTFAPGALTAADPSFSGYYVQGTWVVTGESRRWQQGSASWAAPQPKTPFARAGGMGALELGVRYSVLDLNENAGSANLPVTAAQLAASYRGGEQRITTLGANWYVNNNIRFMLNYLFVDVEKLEQAVASRPVGQRLGILGFRTQMAF